jgi:hypothetical protein
MSYMTELSKTAAMARTAGKSYGKYVASMPAPRRKAKVNDPSCAICPQLSTYRADGETRRFCNAMNRPVEEEPRTSPPWCWLRVVRMAAHDGAGNCGI